MCIENPAKMTAELRRSGMDTALAPMICARAKEHMPLLRSSVDHLAHVAINMALHMELFEWQPPTFRHAKDACKV